MARKIDENRETIRRVVNTLEDKGYVEYDDGLHVVDHGIREAGLSFLAASADVSPPTISEAYVLPHFAGMDFAYTSIDAVYVWTRGGYQVARDPDDYPLFIAIDEADLEKWERFFHRFGIPVAEERQPADEIDGPLQIVLEPREVGGAEQQASPTEREGPPDERARSEATRETLEAEFVDSRPVIPLQETIEFAREYYATFQSALDMLDQMYEDVGTDADYRQKLT